MTYMLSNTAKRVFTMIYHQNKCHTELAVQETNKNYQRAILLVSHNISTEYYMAPGGMLCNLLAPTVNPPTDTIQT